MRKLLPLLLVALLLPATMNAQQVYGSASLSMGNGPDLAASYGSIELGAAFGSTMAGAALGRDLASEESEGLYFAELRGTHMLPLFDDGPMAYVAGGIGQYLDGRWVNEFGAGLSWDNGLSVGACSFGGYGYLSIEYTFMP